MTRTYNQYRDYFNNWLQEQTRSGESEPVFHSELSCADQQQTFLLDYIEVGSIKQKMIDVFSNSPSGGVTIQRNSNTYPEKPNQMHIVAVEEGYLVAGMLTEKPLDNFLPQFTSDDISLSQSGSLNPLDHVLGKACAVKAAGKKLSGKTLSE